MIIKWELIEQTNVNGVTISLYARDSKSQRRRWDMKVSISQYGREYWNSTYQSEDDYEESPFNTARKVYDAMVATVETMSELMNK